jgi:hypothetical protein
VSRVVGFIRHEFVEFMPPSLDDGVLYVSIPYGTVAHRCCCGCGHKVITPLSPAQWCLTYDGETISLSPSVGNHNLACRSHYLIRENRVHWARKWTEDQITEGRARDRRELELQFADAAREPSYPSAQPSTSPLWLLRVKRLFRRLRPRH